MELILNNHLASVLSLLICYTCGHVFYRCQNVILVAMSFIVTKMLYLWPRLLSLLECYTCGHVFYRYENVILVAASFIVTRMLYLWPRLLSLLACYTCGHVFYRYENIILVATSFIVTRMLYLWPRTLSLRKCYTCGHVLKVIIDLWILFDGKVLEVFYRAQIPVTKKLRYNKSFKPRQESIYLQIR